MNDATSPPRRVDADAIDALLPQTQCTKCGFSGCRPYAEAIAAGEADIDRCPPGGTEGVRALAELLGVPPKPLNPAYGVESEPIVAWIDEAACIGCTRCIQACPVDAILGAAKRMHTVIASECTGCELCIPPCPVDCIQLRPAPPGEPPRRRRAAHFRARFEFRRLRLAREEAELAERRRQRREAKAQSSTVDPRKAYIAAALERVKQKKARLAAQQTAGNDRQNND